MLEQEHQGHGLHSLCEHQLCSGLQSFKEVSCNHDDIRQLTPNLGLLNSERACSLKVNLEPFERTFLSCGTCSFES